MAENELGLVLLEAIKQVKYILQGISHGGLDRNTKYYHKMFSP